MKKFFKASAFITLLVLLGKVLGLCREMVMADIFGTSEELDVFLLVSNVPVVIFYLIGNGVTTSLLPLLKQSKLEGNGDLTRYRSFATFTYIGLLVGGLALFALGQLFAREIVLLVAPGFSSHALGLATEYLRFFLLLIFFLGIEGVSTALLQVNGHVTVPSVANFLYGVTMLVPMFFLRDQMCLDLLAVILVCAYAVRTFTNVLCLILTDYHPVFDLGAAKPYLATLLRLAPPVIVATVLIDINFLIDKSFASMVGEGVISALNYSEKVVTLVTGTLFSALGFVFFPVIVNKYYEDRASFRRTSNRAIQVVAACGMACSVFCCIEAHDICVALFKSGAFNEQSVNMTTTALVFYSFAIVTTLLRDMLKNISFAMQDTKTPLVGSFLNCAVNVVLMAGFTQRFGLAVITLSTTLASLIEMVFLIVALRKVEPIVSVRQFVFNSGYALGVSILTGFLATSIPVSLLDSERWNAFLSVGSHAVVFAVLTLLLFIPLSRLKLNNGLIRSEA